MRTNSASGFQRRLLGMPRGAKRALLIAADGVTACATLWLAYALKFGDLAAGFQVSHWIYVWALFSAVAALSIFGLYHAVLRFMSVPALFAISSGALASGGAVMLVGGRWALGSSSFSLAAIYALSLVMGVCIVRILARWLISPSFASRVPVIIYGAGDAGAQLAAALAISGRMYAVAFVDDKSSLQGATVAGTRVYSPVSLPTLVRSNLVDQILLAIPGVSRKRRSQIIAGLIDLGVHVQTVPDLTELVAGKAEVSELREISVADLLGRDPVAPHAGLLGASISGKSVMVTGAGGSIGSELARQIVRQSPRHLVLFDVSEAALYQIERELRAALVRERLDVQLVALLGNTRHRDRLEEVMRAYGVQTVYHAAAYKHVPIVEQNVIEGIHNNVLATWCAAEAAIAARVETFVLISTDKAVHPTNVMGATKRYAEIILQAQQQRQRGTRLCLVRFGNVLGSSGSVVPLFQEQIRAGGPVTVTHKEIRRYFMTIPEAASLVIQAGSMALGGEVFVLDMGEPVRINDLARRMIALAGHIVRDDLHPEGTIAIQYTGLRPGEKLFEELLIGDNVSGTDHPMIMRAMEHAPSWPVVDAQLQQMLGALKTFDCERARLLLAEAVREYVPAQRLHDLVWETANPHPVSAPAERRAPEAGARHLRVVPGGESLSS